MKLAVFGATGLTGRPLIEQALAGGHEVTAFVRNPSGLPVQHERLSIVQGDVVTDRDKVKVAVAGKDAVLCTLGAKNLPGTTVLSQGTQNIIVAMEEAGVRRLILQSTLGVGDSRAQGGLYRKVLVPIFLKHVFADKEVQDRLVQESGLDWTIVRPPRLTKGPHTGVYRAGLKIPMSPLFAQISRADVADFMLKQLTDRAYLREGPAVCY